MFPLHDRTRRQLCRAIFLLLGLTPPAVALAWSVSLHSSAYLAGIEANLAAATGLEVHVESVSHPQPGQIRLEGVQLLDPASGQVVASARQVESIGQASSRTWNVIQPEINAALAGGLWTVFEKQCRATTDSPPATKWQLNADEISLRWPGGEQRLVDCSAQFEAGDGQQLFSAEFQSPNGPKDKPIQLRCQRSVSAEKTTTRFYCSTVGAPAVAMFDESQKSSTPAVGADISGATVPCALIAAVLHRENHLGPQSTVAGTLRAEQLPQGWRSEFSGRVQHLDLNAAISRQFPHHLSGNAEFTIRRAIVNSGRLEQCDALLRSSRGAVSQSLLAAAQAMLGMHPYTGNAPQSAPNEVTPIGELALSIKLDANGLLLRGQSGGETGVVIRADGSALLGDAAGRVVPVTALARTLVPDSRVQAPATQETEWLLEMLPMPQVMPRGN